MDCDADLELHCGRFVYVSMGDGEQLLLLYTKITKLAATLGAPG